MDWVSLAIETIAKLTKMLLAEGLTMEEIRQRGQDELGRMLVVEKTIEDQKKIFSNGG